MEIFLVVFFVALVVVVGNALMLLRTAKKPEIPDSVKAKPDDDDADGW